MRASGLDNDEDRSVTEDDNGDASAVVIQRERILIGAAQRRERAGCGTTAVAGPIGANIFAGGARAEERARDRDSRNRRAAAAFGLVVAPIPRGLCNRQLQ